MMHAVYEDAQPPAALGYGPGVVARVRANPTRAQWAAWGAAVVERTNAALAAALPALLGETRIPGIDLSTPEAALAALERDDVPDELWLWLLSLPFAVVERRRELILKNGSTSSATTA